MEIKEFKEKCEAQRKHYDENIKRWERLRDIQGRKYLNRCYSPRNKFNWKRFEYENLCPNCGIKLEKEIIRNYGSDRWNDVIYYCLNCGYEYAR